MEDGKGMGRDGQLYKAREDDAPLVQLSPFIVPSHTFSYHPLFPVIGILTVCDYIALSNLTNNTI